MGIASRSGSRCTSQCARHLPEARVPVQAGALRPVLPARAAAAPAGAGGGAGGGAAAGHPAPRHVSIDPAPAVHRDSNQRCHRFPVIYHDLTSLQGTALRLAGGCVPGPLPGGVPVEPHRRPGRRGVPAGHAAGHPPEPAHPQRRRLAGAGAQLVVRRLDRNRAT